MSNKISIGRKSTLHCELVFVVKWPIRVQTSVHLKNNKTPLVSMQNGVGLRLIKNLNDNVKFGRFKCLLPIFKTSILLLVIKCSPNQVRKRYFHSFYIFLK